MEKDAGAEQKKKRGIINLADFFYKYKRFWCDIISIIPYGPITQWKAFIFGDIEKALEGRDIKRNIIDYYVITLINTVSQAIVFWPVIIFMIYGVPAVVSFVSRFWIGSSIETFSILIAAGIGLVVFILSPILTLFSAACLHIIAKLLGGKGNYNDTLSLNVLSAAAIFTLSIPLLVACLLVLYLVLIGYKIGYNNIILLFMRVFLMAAQFYGLYLLYKGIKHVHGLSSQHAIATVFTTTFSLSLIQLLIIHVFIHSVIIPNIF